MMKPTNLKSLWISTSLFAAVSLCVLLTLSSTIQSTDATFGYTQSAEVLRTADGRIRGVTNRRDKDFVLGGLFPVHSDVQGSGGSICGDIRLERGLERMEAMLFAIDYINTDDSILPDFSIGYDIRDTCNSENIGLDETIDLVITGSQLDIQSCQSGLVSRNNASNSSDTIMSAPTMGIIGAAASRVSVPVASLLRLFTTPQVSYSSSSSILSNRDRYEYFYRTIPSDNLQARAMIDIILKFNWSYISTIYSRNPYGEPGIVELQDLAAQNGICIDLNEGIDDDYTTEQYQMLAQRLVESDANVVVLFASGEIATQILGIISNTTSARRFTWIASDAWARSISVVNQFNTTAAGLYGIAPLTEHVPFFQNYFENLTIESNQRNPWFEEFYSALVECTLDNETNQTSNEDICDRNLNVTRLASYEQGNFIPLVIDAVYTFARALDNFLKENCDQPLVWDRSTRRCTNQSKELNGQTLLQYIQNVTFESPTGNNILFDTEGNVEGRYEILNYQAVEIEAGEREYMFKRVATWDSSVTNDNSLQALMVNSSIRFQFGIANDTSDTILYTAVESQCGRCNPGSFRRPVQSSCCGICDPCVGQTYSTDPLASSCSECEDNMWGNNPLEGSTGCVLIREEFLRFSDGWSVFLIIIAIFGLVCVAATATVFFIYRKTPVVKSSGREQMILILIGIGACFVLSVFFVSPPLEAICSIQRLGLWTCFSLMFGALLVKIVRVARIFLRKTNLAKPRFTEPIYQVLFTSIIVFVQIIISVISLAIDHPEVLRFLRRDPDLPDNFPLSIVTCNRDSSIFFGLSVAYETSLLIVSTILGVLSFQYPENFNEAKYVAFCTFAVLVIWVAFIPTYIATESSQEFQNAAISLVVVMTAFAVLVCIFGPKLYIILFKPARNTSEYSHHSGAAMGFHTTEFTKMGSKLNISHSAGARPHTSGENVPPNPPITINSGPSSNHGQLAPAGSNNTESTRTALGYQNGGTESPEKVAQL